MCTPSKLFNFQIDMFAGSGDVNCGNIKSIVFQPQNTLVKNLQILRSEPSYFL